MAYSACVCTPVVDFFPQSDQFYVLLCMPRNLPSALLFDSCLLLEPCSPLGMLPLSSISPERGERHVNVGSLLFACNKIPICSNDGETTKGRKTKAYQVYSLEQLIARQLNYKFFFLLSLCLILLMSLLPQLAKATGLPSPVSLSSASSCRLQAERGRMLEEVLVSGDYGQPTDYFEAAKFSLWMATKAATTFLFPLLQDDRDHWEQQKVRHPICLSLCVCVILELNYSPLYFFVIYFASHALQK